MLDNAFPGRNVLLFRPQDDYVTSSANFTLFRFDIRSRKLRTEALKQ